MPTKRTPRSRQAVAQMRDDEREWLLCDDRSFGDVPLFRQPLVWAQHGQWAVQEYVRQHPGRRPGAWWKFESPERRMRLGGIGSALFAPDKVQYIHIRGNYHCGIPLSWCSPSLVFVTREGLGIPDALPIDTRDPPTFESQATYLQRLGLLLPGEAKRLKPADFDPEVVLPRPEPETVRPPVATPELRVVKGE
jgi:hypothetical protein